ncbi:MAG: hypothetical protein KIC84_11610 [Dysgonomonas mossii]|uniref:hypothetical protein n=1 Tax=Dysgonomonas mossii TaxID=163665 RepID=UPI0026EAD1D6|nr:hypothetical protein [Dysgonomonas mossii]MBS5907861.1 hypothetical protein [Dysgonomonas mossii]
MAKRKGSTGLQVALRYKRFSELRKQGLKVEDIGKIVGYNHATVSYGIKMYNQNQIMYDKIIEENKHQLNKKATPHH